MWLQALDEAADRAVERLARQAAEPFLVRRALTEFRSPGHTMVCALRRDTGPGDLVQGRWLTGRAVIMPRHLVFLTEPNDPAPLRLDVRAVVETRETRTRSEDAPGPRKLGVWKLLTSDGTLRWAAHRTLLAEAADILRDTGRIAPS